MLARDDPKRGNLREVERTLRRCAAEARRQGVDIVHGSFDEDINGGVCALAAYEHFSNGDRLGLPDDDETLAGAWDAIEFGFDGIEYAKARRSAEHPIPRRWYNLGRRLRRALKPRKART